MWIFIIKSYIFHLFDGSNNQLLRVPPLSLSPILVLHDTSILNYVYFILKGPLLQSPDSHDFHHVVLMWCLKEKRYFIFQGAF